MVQKPQCRAEFIRPSSRWLVWRVRIISNLQARRVRMNSNLQVRRVRINSHLQADIRTVFRRAESIRPGRALRRARIHRPGRALRRARIHRPVPLCAGPEFIGSVASLYDQMHSYTQAASHSG